MTGEPFTIRVFVADGDPDGLRLVDRLNWTGLGVVFPRNRWDQARIRPELNRTGVYVLVGYRGSEDDLPTIYIGEGDVVRDRIESHTQKKDFWDRAYAFVTSNGALNKAHVRWLEGALIERAARVGRSRLDNGTQPGEPPLSEAERADSRAFLREMLQVLPVVGLHVFADPAPVAVPAAGRAPVANTTTPVGLEDDVVIVVPAQEEGFQQVFLGEGRWRAVRIAGGRLNQVRHVAAYRTAPTSAITHLAPLQSIEPYGENGKYQLIFSAPAEPIRPIPFGDAPQGSMQGTRYTTLRRLRAAKSLNDLFGVAPARALEHSE